MCGIWGAFPTRVGGFSVSDIDRIEQQMIISSLRGSDSTGIAMLENSSKKPRVFKTAGGPAYLLNTDAWTKIREFLFKKATVAFGHGRAATKGGISSKNAHPFTVDHITLVHNGTIHSGLEEEHLTEGTEVDSLALCSAIANKGLVDALFNLRGAYAIIVHDSKEKCIYIVRNGERPLHRIRQPEMDYILSEEEMCKFLGARSKFYVPKIEYFLPHIIYKYDIDTYTWSENHSLKEKEQKKYPPWTGTGGEYSKIGHTPQRTTNEVKRGYVSVYGAVELFCTKVETLTQKNMQYRYTFIDNDNNTYIALSSTSKMDCEGESCSINSYKIVKNDAGVELHRFIFFKEIKWEPDQINVEAPKEESMKNGVVYYVTRNQIRVEATEWANLQHKGKCRVCSGRINLYEAGKTILFKDKTMICAGCAEKNED
jgi:hypothetical protein